MNRYIKWISAAGASAALLLLSFLLVHAEQPRDLDLSELTAIRGASTGGGCVPSNPQTICINPTTWPNGNPRQSTCETCYNTWKNITWDTTQMLQCQYYHGHSCATTGTEYLNQQYWYCVTPSTPNNKVCNSGTVDCTWRVDCDEGGLVSDKNCGGAGPVTCITNAPPIITGTGQFLNVQCRACYVCTTGAPNVPPKWTADTGQCEDPPPGG